ncbi:MAG: sigma-70 family RNA polymerase sigma factor [Deltaproteobacteria bacterium]|nr:sigma-70 family RNA polymerase sigma factor [Deltaproteobacteria bacterium]
MASPPRDPDALWLAFQAGDRLAQDALLGAYYEELRTIARRLLSGDSAAQILQPTELANEAVLRMLKIEHIVWKDRVHFLAVAATVMRQALLDEVRKARALKRKAPTLVTRWPDSAREAIDIEALDEALAALREISRERAELVEMRFFAGLTMEEIASVRGVSDRTVKRQWRAARAWLLARLGGDAEEV